MQNTTSSHKITHIGDTRSAFCKCTTQFEVATHLLHPACSHHCQAQQRYQQLAFLPPRSLEPHQLFLSLTNGNICSNLPPNTWFARHGRLPPIIFLPFPLELLPRRPSSGGRPRVKVFISLRAGCSRLLIINFRLLPLPCRLALHPPHVALCDHNGAFATQPQISILQSCPPRTQLSP